MKIKDYIKEYSNGEPIKFREVIGEVNEFLAEVFKWNRAAMREEFEDVLHFFQLWLFWRFGLNGEIWGITRHSVAKFMGRKAVWRKIYVAAGLPKDSSNFCGNCNKMEKVVKHLRNFGIEKEKAEAAFRVTLGKN